MSSCDFSEKVYMKDDKLFDFHILPFNEYRGLSFQGIFRLPAIFIRGRKPTE